jgi:hypothetical protein
MLNLREKIKSRNTPKKKKSWNVLIYNRKIKSYDTPMRKLYTQLVYFSIQIGRIEELQLKLSIC